MTDDDDVNKKKTSTSNATNARPKTPKRPQNKRHSKKTTYSMDIYIFHHYSTTIKITFFGSYYSVLEAEAPHFVAVACQTLGAPLFSFAEWTEGAFQVASSLDCLCAAFEEGCLVVDAVGGQLLMEYAKKIKRRIS